MTSPEANQNAKKLAKTCQICHKIKGEVLVSGSLYGKLAVK